MNAFNITLTSTKSVRAKAIAIIICQSFAVREKPCFHGLHHQMTVLVAKTKGIPAILLL